jgi:hypothetical protein
MAHTLFLLFNHNLTDEQKQDALVSLSVTRIVELPSDLKAQWSNVPPEIPELKIYVEPVKNWLYSQAQKGDYVLIQGDFGASYIMVNYAFEKGLIPVYATTKRQIIEERENVGSVKVTRHFRHEIFRKYER